MSALENCIVKAQKAGKKIVLPEGHDPRVVKAANMIVEKKIAKVTVLGTEKEISESCKAAGVAERKFMSLDHLGSDLDELRRQCDSLRENFREALNVLSQMTTVL